MPGANSQRDNSSTFDTSSSSLASSSSVRSRHTHLSLSPGYKENIATRYDNVIEAQSKQISSLQCQIVELNKARYARLTPADGTIGRGKNCIQTLKMVCMTNNDTINQQAVSAYLRKVIWPFNKVLPCNWTKWREGEQGQLVPNDF
jgi:hypothetical protein